MCDNCPLRVKSETIETTIPTANGFCDAEVYHEQLTPDLGAYYYWGETQAGNVDEIPCNQSDPGSVFPTARRECSQNATWQEADLSDCVAGKYPFQTSQPPSSLIPRLCPRTQTKCNGKRGLSTSVTPGNEGTTMQCSLAGSGLVGTASA